MKFMNKIDKKVRRNDIDTAQLYEHVDVHEMYIIRVEYFAKLGNMA